MIGLGKVSFSKTDNIRTIEGYYYNSYHLYTTVIMYRLEFGNKQKKTASAVRSFTILAMP